MAAKKPRIKTGVKGIPVEKGYSAVSYYFQYDLDKKDISKIAKDFVKKRYSKDDAEAILANSEWNFNTYNGIVSAAYCMENSIEFPDAYQRYPQEVMSYFDNLLAKGKGVLRTKKALEEADSQKKILTPQQRLANKINETIMVDIDTLEDEWFEGKTTELDIVEKFRLNGLKGMAVTPVVEYLKRWLPEYEDAHSGSCAEAKEAYAHLSKRELARRIKVIKQMLADLDKFKFASKATRTTRVKKPKAADKQVAKVKYQKEDTNYNIASVDPINLVGGTSLFAFNTKTRKLTYYFTDATSGFEISGTSIKNFDMEQSIQLTLRANKVDEVLSVILKKTPNQINKYLATLTSKKTTPNGRLNDDTILLRIL